MKIMKMKMMMMVIMGSSEFRVLALFTLASMVGFLLAVEASGLNDDHGGNVKDYITWDDLMVDENALAIKSNNDGQVIVVDQLGNGDSSTVQGAVDMVPDPNIDRVKIFIYPGIYRSAIMLSFLFIQTKHVGFLVF